MQRSNPKALLRTEIPASIPARKFRSLNIASRHAPRIQSDDLVVKTGKAALTFGQDDRLKAGITITGNGYIEPTKIPFDAFPVTAIAGVAGMIGHGSIFMMAKMLGHLSLHGSLQKLFGQLL